MNNFKDKFIWYMTNFKMEREYNQEIETDFILDQIIELKPNFRNDEIFICKYFCKTFGFYPRMLYQKKPYGVLLFVSKKPFEILSKKYIDEMTYFRNKIGTRIYILKTPKTIRELIEMVFSHVEIIKIKCKLSNPNKDLFFVEDCSNFFKTKIRIFIKLKDSEIPLALGRKGHYIHLINSFLKTFSNVNIYLRS